MLDLTFSYNPAPLDRVLGDFQASLADYSPALRLIADDFREMVSEQFASEGRAGGTPWAGLAPSTARRKRGGSSLLVSSGALLRSFSDSGAPGHLEEIDGQSLTIGSSLPYALFHQTGAGWGFGRDESPMTPRQGRGMPMRPIIVVSSERSDLWTEILREYLEEKVPVLGAKELGGSLLS